MSTKKRTVKHFNCRFGFCGLLAAAILLLSSSIVSAADYYWNVSSGDWSTAANWYTGIEPTSSDNAYIDNGGAANITQDGEKCSSLYLGAADSGTVDMTSGGLTVGSETYVGFSGTGTFAQSGGTHSIANNLYLGYNSSSNGTYNLSGTGQLSIESNEYIGYDGTGTFTQSGGTNITSDFMLGMYGAGTYNLSGTGQLSVASNEYIGYDGIGTFTQTGGTNSASDCLYLGYNSGSNGTYNLSNTGQLSAGSEYVGYDGTGTFTQSGGTNSIDIANHDNFLYLGYNPGSDGIYNLSGTGELSAVNEYIGNTGTGAFTQTGGANSTSGLYIGYDSGASGTYNLSGTGQLSADVEYIGGHETEGSVGVTGTGTFTQTGGTHSISTYLCMGHNPDSSGTYNLSGTGQLSAGAEFVGHSGTGMFNQTGGTNSTDVLYVGCDSGSSGTYNLSGDGQLSVGLEFIGNYYSSGTFNQTGGTNSVTSSLFVGYDLGSGTFNHSGGTNSITDSLYVGGYYDSSGTYNLSDTGQLSAAKEYVGYDGTGTFTQTGGTNSITSDLNVGYFFFYLYQQYSGISIGTYNLIDGQLSADCEYIANSNVTFTCSNSGTFNQSGGTNSITKDLYLGYNPSSSGTYNLSGSGELSAIAEYVGYDGTGAFTQTGGTNTATYIKVGLSGSYTLTGGTLNINGGFENFGSCDLSYSTAQLNTYSAIVDLSAANFANIGNATFNIDAHSLLIVPTGYDPEEYFTVNNEGIIHQAGSALDISSAYNIYGIGRINDHVNCQGLLTATTGYFINLNGGLTVSGTGSVDLGSGSLYVNDATSGMSGGLLTAPYDYVGSTGTGTFTHTGGTNLIGTDEYSGKLYLGYNSDASGTYILSGTGQLSAGQEYVGYDGTGTFTQSGGTNSIDIANHDNFLYLGYNSSASGTYNLSGSGQLSADRENIGYSGTGTFTQTGGMNSNNSLFIGGYDSEIIGVGTYNLSAGQLSAGTEYIGYNGTGTFTQSGGTNSVSDFRLGYNSGSSGTYELSGTGQLSASSEFVSFSGTGTFNQTGGTNSITNALYFGYTSSSSGTYNLSGTGQLSAGTEYVGYNIGTGTFNQSGGTNSITNSLYIARANSSSTGTYNLSDTGQLSAGSEYVGYDGTGTFNQSGGTNSITSNLYLGYNSGSRGTYNLSATGNLSAVNEYVGNSGTGTFTQTGGTNTATYIKIGASGTYTLSGGTLNTNGGLENYGSCDLSSSAAQINMYSSIVNLTGTVLITPGTGTINIDAHSLLILPAGYDPEDYFTVTNSGIIHNAGSALNISSAYNISGIGSINDQVSCQGRLTATAGYFINLNGGVTVSGTGSVNLGTGILYVNDTSSGISGGSLTAPYQYVGSTGTGTFTHSSGTNSITNNLFLGYNSGSSGTYNLSGGTNSITNNLYLGYNSGSRGAYNLSGTGNLSAADEYIGYSGTGTFTQTGGTNSITSNLYFGYNSGSNGTYNLNGGKLITLSIIKGYGTAAFNFGGGTLQASGGFSTSLPMTLTGIGGSANIDTAGCVITLSGVLSGSGGLNKLGEETLVLEAEETYSGDTTINGGTLIFAGGISAGGTSLIDVQAGTAVFQTTNVNKLDLDITTAASVTFEVASGTHEIGAIAGGGMTKIDDGATLSVESICQGELSIGSGAILVIRGSTGEPLGDTFTPVPEPSTIVLLGVGSIILLLSSQRWRKRI